MNQKVFHTHKNVFHRNQYAKLESAKFDEEYTVEQHDPTAIVFSVPKIQSESDTQRYMTFKCSLNETLVISIVSKDTTVQKGVVLPHESLEKWLEQTFKSNNEISFRSMYIWAAVTTMLQITILILILFQEPGITEKNGVPRFISDNLAVHRGYGGVMLLVFTSLYVLLSMAQMPYAVTAICNVLVGINAFSGMGVVLFHDEFEIEHLTCATIFIISGYVLHLLMQQTGPPNRHTVRDFAIFTTTFISAALFGGIIIYNKMYIYDHNHSKPPPLKLYTSRDVRLYEMWWISAIAEYILYINITVLNSLTAQRIFEHTMHSIAQQIYIYCLQQTYTNMTL